MSNGSEGIAEYPGRPDYTALIGEARRAQQGLAGLRLPPASASLLAFALADAVEALVALDERRLGHVRWLQKDVRGLRHRCQNAEAERDALRGQLAAAEARLAGMTEEWGAGYASHPENRPVQVCNDEATASAYADGRGREGEFRFHVVKRLVGPWAEYRSEGGNRG